MLGSSEIMMITLRQHTVLLESYRAPVVGKPDKIRIADNVEIHFVAFYIGGIRLFLN